MAGVALLVMTALPRVLHSKPLSLPIVYIAAGFGVFELLSKLRGPRPLTSETDVLLIELVTEFVVIISLAGAGLKLERRFGTASWSSVWRLLAVCMILCVVITALLGWWLLGLALAPAILLGGILAPTDPVLAADVQVGPPGDLEDRDEVRFTLTAEAGLNDALAFPFIHLAIAASAASAGAAAVGGALSAGVVGDWIVYDVVYRLVVATAFGFAAGVGLRKLVLRAGDSFREEASEGLFVLGSTLGVYAITEVFHGYGFLAVFVAALNSRGSETEYRKRTFAFAHQLERIVLALTLLGFGALLSEGILDPVTPGTAAVALILVFVVRPGAGMLSLAGSGLKGWEKAGIAFFGIRGMGSLFYLAYGISEGSFESSAAETLWSVTALTILLSVVVHGVAVTPVMNRLDRRIERSESSEAATEHMPDIENRHSAGVDRG